MEEWEREEKKEEKEEREEREEREEGGGVSDESRIPQLHERGKGV